MITIEDLGHMIIAKCDARRIDSSTAPAFRDACRELVRDDCLIYVLDLSGVHFLDSSGVGAVVGLLKTLGGNRRLELCGLSPTVHKVFKLTRLDKIFTIRAKRSDCIAAYVTVKNAANDGANKF